MNRTVEWSAITPMRSSGKLKVKCPSCTPHERKPENRNNKDMAVDYDNGKRFVIIVVLYLLKNKKR